MKSKRFMLVKIIPRKDNLSKSDVEFWNTDKLVHKSFYDHGVESIFEFVETERIFHGRYKKEFPFK